MVLAVQNAVVDFVLSLLLRNIVLFRPSAEGGDSDVPVGISVVSSLQQLPASQVVMVELLAMVDN